jgi:hypothetical protein
MRRIAFVLALIASAGTAHADEPQAQFRRLRDNPHVGVPFHLDLLIQGFEETPQPTIPKLEIPDAQVAFVAAQPEVQRGTQIIQGRRADFVQVTWVLRWQIEPRKEGRLRIPSLTVSQGAKRATATGGEVPVATIPVTDAMKLSLALPQRPIFVGETVPVTLTWMFRAQPQGELHWSVPLAATDAFTVSGPPVTNPREALTIPAGNKDLQLPYTIEEASEGGVSYNRLTATFFLAPRRAGKIDVPASSVIAALPVGQRDFFGNAAGQLFRASDVPRTLEVKPLPETDRPGNFAGAVGDQFSIDVRTSRSVVKLGEPVELAIRVKSDQRLDTLALGRLDGEGGLPKDRFTVPAEPPTGELSDDGKTKTFKVVAQVTGPATEVPALAFSYFDPTKAAYQTIRSEPIALSVAAGSVVSAVDVVAARPSGATAGSQSRPAGGDGLLDTALVDAELALSSLGHEDDRPLGGATLWLLLGLLYAIPIAVLIARSYQLRTRSQREDAAEVRAARRRVEELLDRAATAPARDVAGPLVAALRDLARLLGLGGIDERSESAGGGDHTGSAGGAVGKAPRGNDGGLLARLETESFSQAAAAAPLSPDLRSDAAGLLRRWVTEARRTRSSRAARTAATIVVGLGLGLGGASQASAAPPAIGSATPAPAAPHASAPATAAEPAPTGQIAGALDEARAAYREAMQMTGNPTARKAAFARAAAAFGDAVHAMPGRPELLTDWGNAALAAGDVATAALAYRRALAIDGGTPRARHNLAWLRSRQSDAFRPVAGGATDTLLFFHAWPRARKLLVSASAFALAILLLVPWSGRRRRGFLGLAVLPLAVWITMLASVVIEDRRPDDAVVMDDVVLRAADSAGAPAALPQPLPRGVEVTVLERRDTWTKVRLAGGIAGWVPAGSVERIAP